jgi:hypothetical protein
MGKITHQIFIDMSQNLTHVCHLLKLSPPANHLGFSASESLAMLIQLGFWIVTKLTWYKINLTKSSRGSYDNQACSHTQISTKKL